jgi:hypothetical protein
MVLDADPVLFEVVDIAAAARLAERLARYWNVELNTERRKTIVLLVEPRREPRDLAFLMRQVEAWVEEESLVAIRYELDGRAYVLAAGGGTWNPTAADAVHLGDHRERTRLVAALRSVERLEDRAGRRPYIRGIEGLKRELSFALRLIDQSS